MTGRRNTMREFKICSSNICGMSNRSHFMLDNYADNNKYDVIALQESDTIEEEKLKLSNMFALTDNNSAKNKGSVLYINNEHSMTKLTELNQLSKNIDSAWAVTVIHNKRLIIGSIYLKLNYLEGIQEMITMLTKAQELQLKLKATGIILTGDLNTRHIAWGDSISNTYGRRLVELLDRTKFSILSANSPTFLSTNGCSCIDLMIVTNNLVDN